MKNGTRIEVQGWAMNGTTTWEPAVIAKPRKVNLPLPGAGWHLVKFSDGGKLCIHESRFRVTDNRAAA